MDERKMSEIKASAQINEQESVPFMQPGEKIKRGRGRPRKRDETTKPASGLFERPENQAQPQALPPPIPTAKIVRPIVGIASRLGEGYVGHPKAAMTPEEMDAICESMGLVLDKWMPTIAGQYGAELMLGVALGQYGMRIVAMRKFFDAELEKQRQSEEKAKAQSGAEASRMSDPHPFASQNMI